MFKFNLRERIMLTSFPVLKAYRNLINGKITTAQYQKARITEQSRSLVQPNQKQVATPSVNAILSYFLVIVFTIGLPIIIYLFYFF